jgi:hypothetical protein
MPVQPTPEWVKRLVGRYYDAASQYPDLGHVAVKADTAEWPFHTLGSRTAPGLGVHGLAATLAEEERMPIPVMPHWLRADGQLWQGYFLYWLWDWSLIRLAEQAATRLLSLNEEAKGILGAPSLPVSGTELAAGINEVDAWLSRVYEVLRPAPRDVDDLKVLQLPGNAFAAVGGAVEQLSAGLLGAGVPAPGAGLADVAGRPTSPSRGYCLVAPNTVRWEGATEVQQRLWHLLGALLDCGGDRASFDYIEDVLYPEKDRRPKRLQNDLSALNHALEAIRWPHTYRSKGGYVLIER